MHTGKRKPELYSHVNPECHQILDIEISPNPGKKCIGRKIKTNKQSQYVCYILVFCALLDWFIVVWVKIAK